MTFLGPDMVSYQTYESYNVLSIGEYQVKSKEEFVIANLMAWISPTLIDVFRCNPQNGYKDFHLLYRITLNNNTEIEIVQNFGRFFEFAMVTAMKPQMIQFFNWYYCKQSDGKCLILEPYERHFEIEGNNITALKYSNTTLIAVTAK